MEISARLIPLFSGSTLPSVGVRAPSQSKAVNLIVASVLVRELLFTTRGINRNTLMVVGFVVRSHIALMRERIMLSRFNAITARASMKLLSDRRVAKLRNSQFEVL